jgi:dCTP deaminase
MIISGDTLHEKILSKEMRIEPFNTRNLGPNSYDVTLNRELLEYTSDTLDTAEENKTKKLTISDAGYILRPGHLYIGTTNETINGGKYVPILEGRSSIARLGISVHSSGGLGDYGYEGKFSFHITVVKNTKIYPDMRIAQIWFLPIDKDDPVIRYKGKYQDSAGPVPSMSYTDFLKKTIGKKREDKVRKTVKEAEINTGSEQPVPNVPGYRNIRHNQISANKKQTCSVIEFNPSDGTSDLTKGHSSPAGHVGEPLPGAPDPDDINYKKYMANYRFHSKIAESAFGWVEEWLKSLYDHNLGNKEAVSVINFLIRDSRNYFAQYHDVDIDHVRVTYPQLFKDGHVPRLADPD